MWKEYHETLFYETHLAILSKNWIHKSQYRFFETPEVGMIGIFILLKHENELKLVISDSFNSLSPWKI